jgi:hypothetical protein
MMNIFYYTPLERAKTVETTMTTFKIGHTCVTRNLRYLVNNPVAFKTYQELRLDQPGNPY